MLRCVYSCHVFVLLHPRCTSETTDSLTHFNYCRLWDPKFGHNIFCHSYRIILDQMKVEVQILGLAFN